MLSSRAAACGNDPAWQPTYGAYTGADTDNQLRSYYSGWQADIHGPFTNKLAKSFGDGPTGYMCGIGLQGSCGTQIGCDPYASTGDPPWTYLSLISVANLDTTFNDMYTGITNGQLRYISRISNMSQEFFPTAKEFDPKDVLKWIQFAMAILPLFGVGLATLAPVLSAMSNIGRGGIDVANNFMKAPIDPTPLNIAAMQTFAGDVSKKAQDAVVDWANTTFWGYEDHMNHTILDYLSGGGWVDVTAIPSATVFEDFYFRQMVASTVNSQWRKSKIFTIFQKTDDPDASKCPDETIYYNVEDGGVYCTYLYKETGTLRGHLDRPYGLDVLMNASYGINGTAITKSTARAWRVSGFNFTTDDAWQQLSDSLASDSPTSPFLEGPAWTGTFTLPVCDVGTENWTTAYGDTSSGRFGKMPCCCGPDCKDTAAFVKAANMQGFQTLLRACKAQYADYESVDYGFEWKTSIPLKWAMWGIPKRIGFVLSTAASFGLAVPVWLYKGPDS